MPPKEQARIRELTDRVGENQAIASLHVSRQTYARALAGLGLRRGTHILLTVRLQELAAGPARPDLGVAHVEPVAGFAACRGGHR